MPSLQFSSVQSLSRVQLLRPHESQHARPPCPSSTPGIFSNPCPSSWWCHPPISSSVVPFSSCPQFFSSIRVFSNESVLHIRWPKYWSFRFSISLSNEYSGLISFRMDWLDLLAIQATLKSLLQPHSSKASICQRSTFFLFQILKDDAVILKPPKIKSATVSTVSPSICKVKINKEHMFLKPRILSLYFMSSQIQSKKTSLQSNRRNNKSSYSSV